MQRFREILLILNIRRISAMHVHFKSNIFLAIFCLCMSAAAPAYAEVRNYEVLLDGNLSPKGTGSEATGTAMLQVDTQTKSVNVLIAVKGLTIADLWDRLMETPIGPIHFHKYGAYDSATGSFVGNSELALPVPYGAAYSSTSDGFQVNLKDYQYEIGAKTLQSTLNFEDFVKSLDDGLIVLNLHTDAFNEGEIAGTVRKMP
jgi:hypothetical protein